MVGAESKSSYTGDNPDGEPHTLPRRSTVGISCPSRSALASGVPISQIGRAIDPATLVQLAIPECTQTSTGVSGIQYVDHFGNLVTNILAAYVQGLTWSIVADGLTIGCDQPAFHRPDWQSWLGRNCHQWRQRSEPATVGLGS